MAVSAVLIDEAEDFSSFSANSNRSSSLKYGCVSMVMLYAVGFLRKGIV